MIQQNFNFRSQVISEIKRKEVGPQLIPVEFHNSTLVTINDSKKIFKKVKVISRFIDIDLKYDV